MTKPSGISWERRERIGILGFDNPPLNLGTNTGLALLDDYLTDIENDSTLSVVILRASGRVFSAGSDMKEIQTHLQRGTYATEKMAAEITLRARLAALPVPTIAALDGSAYGGGFDWALSCDMRIAAEQVVLSLPEIEIGSFPGSGSAYRLLRLTGCARAIEFMLFARQMTAREALQFGVVNAIAEDATAYETSLAWAQRIASLSSTAVRTLKAAINGYYQPDQARLNQLQLQLGAQIAESRDFHEGIRAFFDKRPAHFNVNAEGAA